MRDDIDVRGAECITVSLRIPKGLLHRVDDEAHRHSRTTGKYTKRSAMMRHLLNLALSDLESDRRVNAITPQNPR